MQSARKFSTVLGTVFPKRPKTMRPAGLPSISMSKNVLDVTFFRSCWALCVCVWGGGGKGEGVVVTVIGAPFHPQLARQSIRSIDTPPHPGHTLLASCFRYVRT